MSRIYPLVIFFILSLFLAACKKDNQQKNTKTVPSGVYVAGTRKDTAVFWKDGVVNKLPMFSAPSRATGIYVTDKAIYVCGFDGYHAALWVNGVETTLAGNPSQASSVYVSGNDVYVAGLDNFIPVYWKNGKELTLNRDANSTGGYVYGIYVANGDVYVAGAEYFGPPIIAQYATPVIWKNGAPTRLLNTSDNSFAWAVAVSGNDVYAIGNVNSEGVMWKNGVETVLAPVGFATSLFISGNDVYVGGLTSTDLFITYWKNGVETATPVQGQTGPGPPAIYVANNNVYMSGTVNDGSGLVYSAYWANGKQTNISDITTNELYINEIGTAATGIFVKQ